MNDTQRQVVSSKMAEILQDNIGNKVTIALINGFLMGLDHILRQPEPVIQPDPMSLADLQAKTPSNPPDVL